MYTKDFCNELLEKIAQMEQAGMPPQGMSPGSGGLVPGGAQDPNAMAGAGPAGPKAPKVKPEQLYERMLKMTGRMADMSAQLGQTGQQSQSMEQMVREDQQEMQSQNMMGMQQDPMQQDPNMGMQQDPSMMQQPQAPGMGLQPQASFKEELLRQMEKQSLAPLAIAGAAQVGGMAVGAGVPALGNIGTRIDTGSRTSSPFAGGRARMMRQRKLNTLSGGLSGTTGLEASEKLTPRI